MLSYVNAVFTDWYSNNDNKSFKALSSDGGARGEFKLIIQGMTEATTENRVYFNTRARISAFGKYQKLN